MGFPVEGEKLRGVIKPLLRSGTVAMLVVTLLPAIDSQAKPLSETSDCTPPPAPTNLKIATSPESLFNNQSLVTVSWDAQPGVSVNYRRNDPATNWPENAPDKVIDGVTSNSVQEELRNESAQSVWLDPVKDGCVGSSTSLNFHVTSPDNNAPVEAVVFEKGPDTPWRVYGPDMLVSCPTGTTHYQIAEEKQNPWGFPKGYYSYPFADGKKTYTSLYMEMEGRENGVYKGEGTINCLDIDWQGNATWLSSMKKPYSIKVTDSMQPDTTPVKDLTFNPSVVLLTSDAKNDYVVSKEEFTIPCGPESKYWQVKSQREEVGFYQIAGSINPDQPSKANFYSWVHNTKTWPMEGLAMIECLDNSRQITSYNPVFFDIRLTDNPLSENATKVVPTIMLPKTFLDRTKVGWGGDLMADEDVLVSCPPNNRVLLGTLGSYRQTPGMEHSGTGISLDPVYNWEHPQATRYSTRDNVKNGNHITVDDFSCWDEKGMKDRKAVFISQKEVTGTNPPKEIKPGQVIKETLRKRYERSGRVFARYLDFYCPTGTEAIAMDDADYQQKREAYNLWGFEGISGGHMDGFPVNPRIYLPSSFSFGVYKGTGVITCYDVNDKPTAYQFPYELTLAD